MVATPTFTVTAVSGLAIEPRKASGYHASEDGMATPPLAFVAVTMICMVGVEATPSRTGWHPTAKNPFVLVGDLETTVNAGWWQEFAAAVDGGIVHVYNFFALAAVGLVNGFLHVGYRMFVGNDVRHLEEGTLHD